MTNKRVVFRTDASSTIGSGHVMRCLTLAHVMRRRGAESLFVCREHEGNLCAVIEEQGFDIARLPVGVFARDPWCAHASWLGAPWEDDVAQATDAIRRHVGSADLLVVDHYALDRRWESEMRALTGRMFVIDDLADRPHECDLLLDQNLHDAPESCYAGLVPESARIFIGPQYALLRSEFDAVTTRVRNQGLKHLLAFFGGVDPTNEAVKLVHALRALGREAPHTHLIVGRNNPELDAIRKMAADADEIDVIVATTRMARMMDQADLGVGTCGGAAWERCAVGLPALVVVNAANQSDSARLLHALGAVRNLGDAAAATGNIWADAIQSLLRDPDALREMSRAAAAVVLGRQDARRELEAALVL